MSNAETLISVRNVKKYFPTRKGQVHAVDDVSFDIKKGETLSLVGESGCGKSTTGRAVIRLLEPNSGSVIFGGEDILALPKSKMKDIRKNIQMVFQDPYSSLNPRLNVASLIGEPLEVNSELSSSDQQKRIKELMEIVGLAPRLYNAYPHELDGGRRQRVGIARALALNPKFIVLDEPVSALDVSIQAQTLNLLDKLQKELGLTYLFISHDLSVVHHVSNRIAVMYLGKIVEITDYRTIFASPKHPYTKALLSAITIPDPTVKHNRILLKGDVPSPINPPAGCRFAGRCYLDKIDACHSVTPKLISCGAGHQVACHLVEEI